MDLRDSEINPVSDKLFLVSSLKSEHVIAYLKLVKAQQFL